jgi:hypothetical protein
LASQPPLLSLLISSPVVLSVVLAVTQHAAVNLIFFSAAGKER